MARLRSDNSVGTLGASLSSSDVTITFASAPSFATIAAGDFIPLVLDPPGAAASNGNYEVVYLTAYTAGATTGTILRGMEGTTGVAHASGATWLCSPTSRDLAGGSTGSRILFRDSCIDANLPVGLSTSGTIGYNSTRKTRTLAGGSTYTLPTLSLNSSITWFFDIEWTSTTGLGDCIITFKRVDTGHISYLKSQASDQNLFLWPMTGGAAMYSQGSAVVLQGGQWRFMYGLSDTIDLGFGSGSTVNSSVRAALSRRDLTNTGLVFSGAYNLGEVIAAGTGIQAYITLAGTRTAELSQVVAYQGSSLP